MNIYSKKQQWKWALLIVAVIIVFTSLWYTNKLVNGIKTDEEKKVRLWAEAVQKKAGLVKFTNDLFQKLQSEERKKAELYALATKELSSDVFTISEFNFADTFNLCHLFDQNFLFMFLSLGFILTVFLWYMPVRIIEINNFPI